MDTMSKRIESLRIESGLSRMALAGALGFPKVAFERFETGRQTPSKEQQQKLADYFGVSLFYLRGESTDRTRQDDWMSMSTFEPSPEPTPVAPLPKKAKASVQPNMMEALFSGQMAQSQLRAVVLDVLQSPQGQALLAKAVEDALKKK